MSISVPIRTELSSVAHYETGARPGIHGSLMSSGAERGPHRSGRFVRPGDSGRQWRIAGSLLAGAKRRGRRLAPYKRPEPQTVTVRVEPYKPEPQTVMVGVEPREPPKKQTFLAEDTKPQTVVEVVFPSKFRKAQKNGPRPKKTPTVN